MSNFLFNEFEQVSSKQWKQKIQFDLKGEDYNDLLVWESNEGIKVKPFYHYDDVQFLNINPKNGSFLICQSIFVSNEKTANFLAKDALKRGANSIEFEANKKFDVDKLLQGLVKFNTNKEPLQIHYKLNFLSDDFLIELIDKSLAFKIFLNVDIIGNLAKTGNWFNNSKKDVEVLETVLKKATGSTTVLSVNTSLYQNAGANIVQQVAYGLAQGSEYLNIITAKNIPFIYNSIQFLFTVGTNYFFEIAKLRAFRYLWPLISEKYNIKVEAKLFVKPTLRNKTIYDCNVNLLRTTTECMSAVLGGADFVSNVAYDSVFRKKNEFGERIARNQLLILQEESHFNAVNNSTEGSYYIETLTKQIAEKALNLFKDIEKNGGFLKQLRLGKIQRKIEESAAQEQLQFDKGVNTLLGINKQINQTDKMKSEIELYPFVKIKPRKTKIKPIIAKRLAEKLEKKRLNKE